MDEYQRHRRRRTALFVAPVVVAAVGLALFIELRSDGHSSDDSLRAVDWSSSAVPATMCGGSGMTQVQEGMAIVSSSRWPDVWAGTAPSTVPNQVELRIDEPVRFGDLGGNGVVEAVVPVWCTNGGGTAAGQLGHGLAVFTETGGRPAVMGIITTSQPDTYHTPYFDNRQTRIEPDAITVEELWYGESDGTCCPTGRAERTWEFTGATLIPGMARVTTAPDVSREAPTVVEPFTALPCNPDAGDTISTVGCTQQQVIEVDHQIDAVAVRIFDRLSTDARRRFVDGESAWWQYRLAVCESRGTVFEGGSAAQVEVVSCFLDRSREHLADLIAFEASLSQQR